VATWGPARDLAWDRAVGWDVDRLPPGVTSGARDPGEYLKLEYAGLERPGRFAAIIAAGVPLRDRSLIARPADLCAPAFGQVIAQMKPDRLLLRITGGLGPEGVDCLRRVPVPALYLALCPDDGTTIWACDGDAELVALAAAPGLLGRIRGLAIGFGERKSWALLARLEHLEDLLVRGPVLGGDGTAVDVAALATMCGRSDLAVLDLFDAQNLGRNFPLPADCAYQRVTYAGVDLPRSGPAFDHPDDPAPGSAACKLRRVFLWHLDAAERAALQARCPSLERIETVEH
jgi:hypothetical protein